MGIFRDVFFSGRKWLLLILGLWLSGSGLQAQLQFGGYLSNMQDLMFEKVDQPWIHDNLIHNRLRAKWFAGEFFTANIELRNRFYYGTSLSIPGYNELFSRDAGWVDLSWDITQGPSYILNSMIDRLWLNFRFNKFEIRIGRQRLNWGQTFVWNPNDIFNAYSFFDVDYPEKPGSDAIRIQYFSGTASKIELTAKLNHDDQLTAGTRFTFSPGMYDIQYFAGILNSTDWVTGLGWSGSVGGAGFKGEVTFFQPRDSTFGSGSDLMASVGADYVLKNSLALQIELLYSSVNYSFGRFSDFYFMPLSVKNITFTDFNLFGQISYPITPLFNGSFSMIWYPSISGFFLGPTLSYSLSDNIDFSVFFQYFDGEFSKQAGRQKLNVGFVRLKWSF